MLFAVLQTPFASLAYSLGVCWMKLSCFIGGSTAESQKSPLLTCLGAPSPGLPLPRGLPHSQSDGATTTGPSQGLKKANAGSTPRRPAF